MRSVSVSGSQTSGRKFAARRDASTLASILSAFTCAWAMTLTCVGWPRSPSRHAAQASARPPWHCRSPRRRLRPPCAACAQSPRGLLETISTRPAGGAGRFPDYHLRERAVDFHADHASHQVLLFGVAEQEQWATRQLRIRARGEPARSHRSAAGGGFGPECKDTFRSAWRAEGAGLGRQVRIFETRCIGICPKNRHHHRR